MTDEHKTDTRVILVPMMDTGLGLEAGYANDRELIEAANAQRQELKALLTPETWANIEEAEAKLTKRILGGMDS
jgi:hypothetical protein